MTRFPTTVEDLTPELLTLLLAERRPAVAVERVRVIETSHCGDGFASTADRAILGLDYAPGCDSGLPTRVLLKTMLKRSLIPDSMYENEVRFYRDIRPELTIEAPRAFASVFDEETGQFGVLMEDLTLRSARFPNATTPVALEEVTGLVHTLAALHAHYWASSRFQRDLRWLPTPRSGGMYEIFKGMGLELVRDQVAKNDFKAESIRPLNRSVDQLWEALWKVQDILDSGPGTLLHGDPHIGNTYLLRDGNGGLLDWQLMVKGRWAHDLTYLLVTALDPDDRRKHERELIATYLDELRRGGVERPPNENEAWMLYRQAVVWGLVIGWLITPPRNYGEAITAANLFRLVSAAQDLETFRAIR
jgi:hypothetical protein